MGMARLYPLRLGKRSARASFGQSAFKANRFAQARGGEEHLGRQVAGHALSP